MAEPRTRRKQRVRDRWFGPSWPDHGGGQAVGPRTRVRPGGRFPSGGCPRGLLREATGEPVSRPVHRRVEAARCDHDEGIDHMIPVTFYTPSLVTAPSEAIPGCGTC